MSSGVPGLDVSNQSESQVVAGTKLFVTVGKLFASNVARSGTLASVSLIVLGKQQSGSGSELTSRDARIAQSKLKRITAVSTLPVSSAKTIGALSAACHLTEMCTLS